MKFEFCGGTDCPEWVLSEVAVLNKVSTIKLRLILAQICKKLMQQPYDHDKVVKLCKDCKLNSEEVLSAIAVLDFILSQAVRYEIGETQFTKELLQLGLPLENVNSLLKSYSENSQYIAVALKAKTFRVS